MVIRYDVVDWKIFANIKEFFKYQYIFFNASRIFVNVTFYPLELKNITNINRLKYFKLIL